MTVATAVTGAAGPPGGPAAGGAPRRRGHAAAPPAASTTEEATAADAVVATASATAAEPPLTATVLERECAGARTAAARQLLRPTRSSTVVALTVASVAPATAASADPRAAPVTGTASAATAAAATAETAAAARATAGGYATAVATARRAGTDLAAAREVPAAAAAEGRDTCLPCASLSRRRQMFVCDAVHATAVFSCDTTDQQDSGEDESRRGKFEASAAVASSSEDEEEEEEGSSWQSRHKGIAGEQRQTLLLSRDTDVMYEQELQRDPFQVKIWCRYLDSKKEDFPAERFLIYERALSSLPGSYKLWWRYLQERVAQAAGAAVAAAAVRTAATALSGSAAAARGDVGAAAPAGEQTPPHNAPPEGVRSGAQRRQYEEVNKVFERALVLLLHMPKVWIFYLRFLQHQQLITRTRRALDRALQSVAITQHDALWRCCMPFFRAKAPVETTVRLYRRCVMRLPEETEAFVDYLQQPDVGRYDHAAELLAELVEDETRSSLAAAAAGGGKTKHQLWLQLCDLVAAHPACIRSLDPEKVLRSGIARFSDEVGRLWCSLASIFLRLGEIEKARDIFEEAVQSVRTVQDLALVYDAYLNFEEGLLAAKIEQQQQRRNSAGLRAARDKSKKNSSARQTPHAAAATAAAAGRDGRASAAERRVAAASAALGRGHEREYREQVREQPDGEEEEEAEQEIDYLMTRLEFLTERRPLLVSSCKLRQNPHNVHEWLARAELFGHDLPKVVETFSEAVASVDPQLAVGRLSVLWLAFGRFYEQHGDLPNACTLYEKAVQVQFRSVDELATVWCEYVEMLLRHNRGNEALQLVRRAINLRGPSGQAVSSGAAAPVQSKLYRSVKLWSLAADVEEMFGSLETVRACYNKMFQLKTITPQLVINYAHLLEEHRFFEESFKVYERGIAAFRWPHLNDLWLMYLTKFVSRYGGQQLERARELFQQATADVPPRFARRLFLLYAKLEEEFGLAKHALSIYHAATKAVLDEEKKDMYYIYIARTTELFGIARTRKIYEEAIETLPEKDVRFVCITIHTYAILLLKNIYAREMCMRYALVERGLGEVDRSRAIYEHCAQFCDPSVHPEFWKAWKDFEVAHGNEDTFKDMLRVKRSVIAQYSQVHQSVLELAQGLAAAEEQRQQAGQQQEEQALAAAAAGDAAAAQRSSAELKRRAETEQKSVEEELFYKKKRQMDEAELAQAEAEFQAVQRQRAQARVMAALPPDAPFFIAAQSFLEPRLGYVFKHGFFGQGYYLDEQQVSAEYYNARVAAATVGPAAREAAETAGKTGGGATGEEVGITLSPDVPEAVYGSLAAAAKSRNG